MSQLSPWSAFDALVDGLAELHTRSQQAATRAVDELLTVRSWLIGAWIIAYEQEGQDRAQYGERLIDSLADAFKAKGIKGLSARNLRNYRQIALTWPQLGIQQTLSAKSIPVLTSGAETLHWQDSSWMARLRSELSLSHLLELARVEDLTARAFYELECLKNRWSVRELQRQRNAMLFERVGLSKDKDTVLVLAEKGRIVETPATILRDPYVLEFLGLEARAVYTESDLEKALVAHLQEFLLELGGDFAFLGQQYRITVGGRHHFIDLLFFHRRLRCLIAVDLKIGAFGYEDAGQMNFYLNFLRENVSLPDENPPVGIILCAEKDTSEVRYATGNLEESVFVSRYLTQLPNEAQLRQWLEEEREVLARQISLTQKEETER
jgi:predicted nuclease of restriction endonuclease-like (RecB) superfamily